MWQNEQPTMNLATQIMCLRQEVWLIKDYVMDFVELANLTGMNDIL